MKTFVELATAPSPGDKVAVLYGKNKAEYFKGEVVVISDDRKKARVRHDAPSEVSHYFEDGKTSGWFTLDKVVPDSELPFYVRRHG
jgi:hypothetical protein